MPGLSSSVICELEAFLVFTRGEITVQVCSLCFLLSLSEQEPYSTFWFMSLFVWVGHYERPPYNQSTIKSVYHVREYDVHKLMQLEEPLDIFLSHDWPVGITDYGDSKALIQQKPYFQEEVNSDKLLGNGFYFFVLVLRWLDQIYNRYRQELLEVNQRLFC